jgi:hypothetical protein
MPEEATIVRFHAAIGPGAGTKGTEAYADNLIKGEVLGVFHLDCISYQCGSARHALGGEHLSLPCVRVHTHDINDGAVT